MLQALVVVAVVGTLALVVAGHESHPLAANARADRIVIEKSARKLTLFRGETPLKSYSVALGRAPEGTKQREGDHRTPEGHYIIDAHKRDSAFHRALHISYPTPSDTAVAMQRGDMQRGDKPGGDIMIHGIRNGLGWLGAFHRCIDWTSGCIAVTDKEIEEIYRAVPDETPIDIRP
jgi:murein L,D-transpeptidase YafK